MNTEDMLAAIYLARSMLDASSANQAFEEFKSAARENSGSTCPDGELFALSMALSGFGMQVRGDFDKISKFEIKK